MVKEGQKRSQRVREGQRGTNRRSKRVRNGQNKRSEVEKGSKTVKEGQKVVKKGQKMARNPQKGQRVVKEKEERKVDSARGSKRGRKMQSGRSLKGLQTDPGRQTCCIVLKSLLL